MKEGLRKVSDFGSVAECGKRRKGREKDGGYFDKPKD